MTGGLPIGPVDAPADESRLNRFGGEGWVQKLTVSIWRAGAQSFIIAPNPQFPQSYQGLRYSPPREFAASTFPSATFEQIHLVLSLFIVAETTKVRLAERYVVL